MKVGDKIKFQGNGRPGTILEIRGKMARVEFEPWRQERPVFRKGQERIVNKPREVGWVDLNNGFVLVDAKQKTIFELACEVDLSELAPGKSLVLWKNGKARVQLSREKKRAVINLMIVSDTIHKARFAKWEKDISKPYGGHWRQVMFEKQYLDFREGYEKKVRWVGKPTS